jgi:acetyl esterase/lipase
MSKTLKRILIFFISLAGILFIVFKVSPYPSVWIIRYAFNKEAIKINKALDKYVPANIITISNVQYDQGDKDAYLNAYYHNDSVKTKHRLPVIVWTHGGGLISGDKNQVSNYCKILAERGYVVIAIDYTIAPEKKYPTPIKQLNKALAFISSNPDKFKADSCRFVLAGDSGGSMISAATANVITNARYAKLTNIQPGLNPEQLKGLILYCGIYEVDNLNTEGAFGYFLQTVIWSYFDKKNISGDEYAKSASVTNYLTSNFPPTFISAGNKDPLLKQSKLLAQKLSALNIPTDTLFYPEMYEPVLGHEYQFVLNEAGKLALDRSAGFISSIAK